MEKETIVWEDGFGFTQRTPVYASFVVKRLLYIVTARPEKPTDFLVISQGTFED